MIAVDSDWKDWIGIIRIKNGIITGGEGSDSGVVAVTVRCASIT
jgi:hypothetical protein